MQRKGLIVIIVVCGVIILYKSLSLLRSEEDKIRQIIYAAKEATEKEDTMRCMSFVSSAYRDKDGNNKAMLFRLAQQVFKSYNGILIDIETAEVVLVDRMNAQAHLICFGQGRRSQKTPPAALNVEKVEFLALFRKEGGRWKVVELRFIDPENFMRLLQ